MSFGVLIKTCQVDVTQPGGAAVITHTGVLLNANMQFEEGPAPDPPPYDGAGEDRRITHSIRVRTPTGTPQPTPGDKVSVLIFASEPRQLGDWVVGRVETGGFGTLLLYVKRMEKSNGLSL